MAEAATPPRWEAVDLSGFLAHLGLGSGATIAKREELSGGASKDLWLIEVRPEGEGSGSERRDRDPWRFVLRGASHTLARGVLPIEQEFAVMRAAFEAGVQVPEPLFLDRSAEGHPFFLMTYVEGETLAPRLFRQDLYAQARAQIPEQLGAFLAPVHQVPCDASLRRVFGDPPQENPAALALAQFESIYRYVAKDPHPVFELAFRHLADTLPGDYDVGLVHGDFRLGNVVFDAAGLRAILDWELAHLGDPMEDLGWATVRAWRFGHDALPVAGLGTREAFHAAYEAAGGVRVDPTRVQWWELFGNLRWGVITLMQALPFLDRATTDLEKGAIGRRAAEVEAELLHLMSG